MAARCPPGVPRSGDGLHKLPDPPLSAAPPYVANDGERIIAVDHQDGEVVAIGFDPAFTLQPMPGERAALPIVAALSLLILLSHLIAHPVAALVRRLRKQHDGRSRAWRRAGWFTWVAVLGLAVSVLPWSAVASALLTDGPAPDSPVIRAGQVLLVIAALGIFPAVWRLVMSFRPFPRRWIAVAWSIVLTAAFGGLIFTLLVGGILQPSLSY